MESAESWQGHNCHRLTLEDTVLVIFLVAVSKYPIKVTKEELILTHALKSSVHHVGEWMSKGIG